MKPTNNTFGITNATSISIRTNPDHKSELVSQLLFGESFKIIQQIDNWLLINTLPIDLQGWIPDNSYIPVKTPGLNPGDPGCYINLEMTTITPIDHSPYPISITPGSTLPCKPEINKVFKIGDRRFRFESPLPEAPEINDNFNIHALALIFIHSPYLWGGRCLFGIDNAGLIQLVYKMWGISLPGCLHELVQLGKSVAFAHDAQAGDLAFFENKEGEIIHAGIITKANTIIHCFGSVREDSLDHEGIYDQRAEKYLFYLRVINRLL